MFHAVGGGGVIRLSLSCNSGRITSDWSSLTRQESVGAALLPNVHYNGAMSHEVGLSPSGV